MASGRFVCDLDVVCVEPLPDAGFSSPTWGHMFASCKSRMHRGGQQMHWRHWQAHYLREPGDALHIQTPWAFPAGSPVLSEWLSWFQEQISAKSSMETYCAPLDKMKPLVAKWGLRQAVVDPIRFSPIPYWTLTSSLSNLSSDHWDVNDMKNRTVAVNNYWQSRRLVQCKSSWDVGSHSRVLPKSAWPVVSNLAQTRAQEPVLKRRKLDAGLLGCACLRVLNDGQCARMCQFRGCSSRLG